MYEICCQQGLIVLYLLRLSYGGRRWQVIVRSEIHMTTELLVLWVKTFYLWVAYQVVANIRSKINWTFCCWLCTWLCLLSSLHFSAAPINWQVIGVTQITWLIVTKTSQPSCYFHSLLSTIFWLLRHWRHLVRQLNLTISCRTEVS